MMILKLDHVVIAGSTLAPLEAAFAGAGLSTQYGGPHSNGVTHMALLGFSDGSYLELISSLQAGLTDAVFWGAHITANGGPCAWAVQVARLAGLGMPVSQPAYYQRRRPDGVLLEWNLVIVGNQGAGAVLPFLITDITPREWRVSPSDSVAGWLTGVAAVIIGVDSLAAAAQLFQRAYGWPGPTLKADPAFQANLAYFDGTPVALAAPLAADDWLAQRLAHLGESPCAYLLQAANFEAACRHFGLTPSDPWFERPCAWFDPAKMHGLKLGIVA
ncbi:MAG: VOC family protein [Anaerolineae bacterium]